jgi:hypothetical protein
VNPCRPEGLEQVLNSPIDADAGKESDQSKEDQKGQRFAKNQTIIEDTLQLLKPLNVNMKSKEKCDHYRYRDEVEDKEQNSFGPATFPFKGEDKREMEEEEGCKGQSDKDHLHAEDRIDRIGAVDHDEFAHIPGGEGKDKTGKEPVGHIFGIAGEYDETKGEVHRKSKSGRKCQDIHQFTFLFNSPSTDEDPRRNLPFTIQQSLA